MIKNIILHPSTQSQADLLISSQNLNSIGVYGQAGSGKSYLASHLVENILAVSDSANHPYVKFINCSKDTGIEQVRGIKAFLQLKVPSSNKFSRAVVFESVEYLGIPAQNALLKTVEEPPAGTVIIITTSNKNSILPTIASRLQWISVLPLAKKQLKDINGLDRSELEKAYLISEGNAGLLLSLAKEPEAHTDLTAAIDEAKEILKCSRFEKLAKVDSIIKNDNYTIDLLLSALIKILRSVIVKNSSSSEIRVLIDKLNSIVEARESLKYKPSSKLLLTSLFNKL
jgi:DNA polymerase III subunit delta'